ncbi:MAG: arylesterase [Leptospira sp.]|nr:arylesterase [Leptospira sp.]
MYAKTTITVVFLTLFFISCGSPIEKKDMVACAKISGVPGPEDLDLVRIDQKPYLIVSVHNRRNMEDLGWIATIDLSLPIAEQKPVKLVTNYPENFRPHGISYAKVNGKDILAVISHTNQNEPPHSIELFERKTGNEWVHTKTLKDELLTGPNDIFLNERGEIFASNDRGPENKFMQYFNMIIKRGTADIAYYDGTKFQNLDNKVVLGNGIFIRMENGEEILYRSVFSEKALSVFKIKRENGNLTLDFQSKISIDSGADNILQDEEGNLWAVGHPSTFKFLRHASNKDNLAPTQVFKINGKTKEVQTMYSNDGSEISAGSTALPIGKQIYISQVFEDFLLTCTKP